MTRTNVTKRIGRHSLLAVALSLGALGDPAFGQGSLTPPGAPAPMMKTLDQIEARVAIGTAPFAISQPGSYYVTGNLTASSGDAITVSASDVTLDLGGFTVVGVNHGISFAPGISNVSLRNGTVKAPNYALYAMWPVGCRFENLTLSGSGDAIAWVSGDNNVIEDCTVSATGPCEDAILSIGGRNNVIRNCSVAKGSGVSGSTQAGIYLFRTAGCVVEDCTVGGTGLGYGVSIAGGYGVGNATGNVVRACTITSAGTGIYLHEGVSATRLEDNTISQGGMGVDAGTSQGNWILNNVCHANATNFGLGTGNTFVPVDLQSDSRMAIDSAPFAITQPGSYYLAESLTVASGTAISVAANDVTLDLNGFTVAGETGIGVAPGSSNVVIQNGSVKGSGQWSSALDAHGTVACRFSKLSVSGSGAEGAVVNFSDAKSTSLEDSTVSYTGGASVDASAMLLGGRGNTVRGCTFTSKGIAMGYYTAGCSIEECTFADAGVGFGPACTGNVVRACIMTGKRTAGMSAIGMTGDPNNPSTGNVVEDNTISGYSWGIRAGWMAGTEARYDEGNFFIHNICSDNGTNLDLSTGNTLVDLRSDSRVAIDSAPFAITQPGSYYLTGNLTVTGAWENAITIASGDVTLDLGGFAVFANNTAVSLWAGNSNVLTNVVIRNGTMGSDVYRALGAAYATSCRFKDLTVRGQVSVSGNNCTFEDCSFDAPHVEDSPLNLGGNNHVVRNCSVAAGSTTGDPGWQFAGMSIVGGSGHLIENCTVSGVGHLYGMRLWGVTGSIVRNCVINNGANTGIYVVTGSSANRLQDNTIGGSGVGIDVSAVTGNWVVDNLCAGGVNMGTGNTHLPLD